MYIPGPSSPPWCTALKYSYTVLYIYIYIFILEPNKARKIGNIWLYGSSVLSLWREGGKPTSKSAFYILYLFLYLLFCCTTIFGLQMFCRETYCPSQKESSVRGFFWLTQSKGVRTESIQSYLALQENVLNMIMRLLLLRTTHFFL